MSYGLLPLLNFMTLMKLKERKNGESNYKDMEFQKAGANREASLEFVSYTVSCAVTFLDDWHLGDMATGVRGHRQVGHL